MTRKKRGSRKEKGSPFQWRDVDPKEIVHYYVDGGIKDGKAASVFVRKGFARKPKEEVRRVFNKRVTSTKSEIRAIKLAVEDALADGIKPEHVVIHTDQKSLVYNSFRRDSEMSRLRQELDDLGFNLAYIPSTHDIAPDVDKSQVPKKVLNALQVHNLVTSTLARGHNRYRHHLNKKRRRASRKS